MDFHPTSEASSDRMSRLISLMEELVSAEASNVGDSGHARPSKMIFSTARQRE
jgi:hypothetical protein